MPDGPQQVLEMMNAMGIPPNKGPGKHYGFPRASGGLDPFPSITLGSATISPINMANGYATIANGGRFHEPYIIEKVESKDGEVLYDHSVSDKQAIDPDLGSDIAADVSYALQQVVATGTGTAALGINRPAAGKTGTATNSLDQVDSAWFTGYTPQLSTSVMYVRGKGNEQLDGWLPSYFGGDYPADTWTAVMNRDMEGVEEEDFPPAANVDGEAPDDGHAPTLPPKPTKTPTPTTTARRARQVGRPRRRPSCRRRPCRPVAPSTEVPTTAPPTTPTDTPTPTPSCDLLGCESPTPTPSATADGDPRGRHRRRDPRRSRVRSGGTGCAGDVSRSRLRTATSIRPWTIRSSPPSARASGGRWGRVRRGTRGGRRPGCWSCSRRRSSRSGWCRRAAATRSTGSTTKSATPTCATPTCPTSTPGAGWSSWTGPTPTTRRCGTATR